MDSMAGPVEPRGGQPDSPNVLVVKDAFDTLEQEGLEAGLERLLNHAHADVEFRPYVAAGRVLRGVDEVRTFFREQLADGTALSPRPTSYHARGDDVIVNGSLRIVRPTGGFSESQLSWTYHFRDGLIQEAGWGPRSGG
jgi:ketosteroid isomerase-like protein